MTRHLAVALAMMLVYGCATGAPPAPQPSETIRGIASWYGEEFAGRTTANGEIFDPSLLTAAHRTLPFGTVVDVTNTKTQQTIRVRVNDRGPYIGGRVIDLSYAAAREIGLVEPGIGDVEIRVVRIGGGEREPPVPFDVTVAEAPAVATPAPVVADPPAIEFPLPSGTAVVDRVEVETERGGTVTRRQVSADGRTIEEVPVAREEATPTAASLDAQRRRPAPAPRRATAPAYVIQVGAFAIEENARALQQRLVAIGQRAFVERGELYRVRIGPFETRDAAAAARSTLEATGISAMILRE